MSLNAITVTKGGNDNRWQCIGVYKIYKIKPEEVFILIVLIFIYLFIFAILTGKNVS